MDEIQENKVTIAINLEIQTQKHSLSLVVQIVYQNTNADWFQAR